MIQYLSIKSLHPTIVGRSFDGASVPVEWHSRTISIPFRFRHFLFCFILFCSCDIETCYFPCARKGPVNASFGAEDGVQLLHMVADGTKAPAFAKLQSY